MNININVLEPLKDIDKTILKDVDAAGVETDIIWRKILINLLTTILPSEDISGAQKLKQYGIATKIQDNNEVALTVDEAALIKERAEKLGSVVMLGRICELLDGKAK